MNREETQPDPKSRWREDSEREGLTWDIALDGESCYRAVAEYLPEARVLEIGPGYGRLIRSILNHDSPQRSYVGLDVSANRVAQLSSEFAAGQISFVAGDIEAPPWHGPTFDLIVSFLTFKHLYPDCSLACRSCFSLLATSGLLVFDVLESLTDEPAGDIGRFFEPGGRCFCRTYSRCELQEILSETGFSSVEFGSVVHAPGKERLLVIARKTP